MITHLYLQCTSLRKSRACRYAVEQRVRTGSEVDIKSHWIGGLGKEYLEAESGGSS